MLPWRWIERSWDARLGPSAFPEIALRYNARIVICSDQKNFILYHYIHWLSQNANVFLKKLLTVCVNFVFVSLSATLRYVFGVSWHTDKYQTLSRKIRELILRGKISLREKISTERNGRISGPIFLLINDHLKCTLTAWSLC